MRKAARQTGTPSIRHVLPCLVVVGRLVLRPLPELCLFLLFFVPLKDELVAVSLAGWLVHPHDVLVLRSGDTASGLLRRSA